MLFSLFLLVAVAQEVPKPNCGGILSGIQSNNGDITNCSWIDLAQPSGKVTRTVPVTMCQDRGSNSNGAPLTVFSFDEHAYFFMTGSGSNVYWVDDATVEVKTWVQLPTHYNYTIGMQALADIGLYILTTSTLYSVPAQGVLNTVLDVSAWKLDETALLSSNFWDDYLYVTQGNKIYSINLTNPSSPVVTSTQSSLTSIIDLEVYLSYVDSAETPTLLVIQNYTIYLLDAATGTSKSLLDIPKGPGSPRINAYGPDTFFFCDDANLYSVDVPSGKLLTTSAFTLGPVLQGFFQYHP
jgi:hypothetical protein